MFCALCLVLYFVYSFSVKCLRCVSYYYLLLSIFKWLMFRLPKCKSNDLLGNKKFIRSVIDKNKVLPAVQEGDGRGLV